MIIFNNDVVLLTSNDTPHPNEQYYYEIYYHENINKFKINGKIVHDLSDLFDVWELEEWKKTKEFGIMISKNGFICEFYYIPATTKGE